MFTEILHSMFTLIAEVSALDDLHGQQINRVFSVLGHGRVESYAVGDAMWLDLPDLFKFAATNAMRQNSDDSALGVSGRRQELFTRAFRLCAPFSLLWTTTLGRSPSQGNLPCSSNSPLHAVAPAAPNSNPFILPSSLKFRQAARKNMGKGRKGKHFDREGARSQQPIQMFEGPMGEEGRSMGF